MGSRMILACALLAAALVAHPDSTAAQDDAVLYSVSFRGVPLHEALDYVIDRTRIDLVYESALVRGRTFCRIEEANEEAVLACVLEGTGVDFIRMSSGTYVLRADLREVPKRTGLVGQIVDAETGTPVVGAHVLIADAWSGTATNLDGRFAVAGLLPGRHYIVVSHVAYQPRADSLWISADAPNRISISVEPRVVSGEPIIITGRDASGLVDSPGQSRRQARSLELPEGVGSPDVIQEIGTMTGVRLGDVESEVHIQGGASNEQQFLLDGMPIFVPVSSGGFIGPFSAFAVEQVTVRKAGFSAGHGSHLSGVVELDHQLGADRPHEVTLQADALSANARWLGKHRVSSDVEAFWMIAGRRALWETYHPPQLEELYKARSKPDLFLQRALEAPGERPVITAGAEASDGELEVGFTDLHGAALLRFGGLRSLKIAFYRGANTFGIEEIVLPDAGGIREFEDAYRWSNQAMETRYEWVASGRLFMSAEAWVSGYELVHPMNAVDEVNRDALQSEFNEYKERGVRGRWDLAVSGLHEVSGALEITHTHSEFRLSLDPFGRTPVGPEHIAPLRWRVAGFLEDEIHLTRSMSVELGTRLTYLPGRTGIFAEPRAAVLYRDVHWAARAAIGLYRQFLHSFDVATYNIASLLPRMRVWLPMGEDQRPPESYHAAAGITYRPAPRLEFSGEAYYKHQPHIIVLNYSRPPSTERPFVSADGYAFGFVTRAAHRSKLVDAEVSYEYSVSSRRIPDRFDGRQVHTPWHVPHRVNAGLEVAPIAALTLTARWQAFTGREWGYRHAYYDHLSTDPRTVSFGSVDLSDPEAHVLPIATQLDLGISYARDTGPASIEARLTLVNVLGRRNVTDWSLVYDEARSAYARIERRGVPFIPLGSLSIRF